MAKVLRVNIKKRTWKIKLTNLKDRHRGWCFHPDGGERVILMDQRLDDLETLEVLAHEVLHASCWDLSEETVTQFADDFARIAVKRFGFRRK